MTTIIDGSLGITFPVTAGSASAVQASSGRVLQVINTFTNSNFASTSTSYVDATGMTATITPSSTTSKVLVIYSINGVTNAINSAGTTQASFQIVNGSGTLVNYIFNNAIAGGSQQYGTSTTSGSFLHSPSTTSAYTYKLQGKGDGSSSGFQVNNYFSTPTTYSSIILMEIAA